MKLWRVLGILGLVALLVPLSGCIGDDDPTPQPKVSGGSEIQEGVPPQKFTFEPTDFEPAGEVQRVKHTRQSGLVPLEPFQQDVVEWTINWTISGLTDLGKGEEGTERGEAFYQIWLGRQDENEEVVWEQAPQGQSTAPEGKIEGGTSKERRYRDYVGIMVTLETKADSTSEIPILQTTAMEAASEEPYPLESLEPFDAAFADARVSVAKDGKVNLTVNAFTLPETTGAYDVFLRNQAGVTYLGTLQIDPTTGGYTIGVTPNPSLFTKYQFFISLELDREKKDEHGGLPVLVSSFKS